MVKKNEIKDESNTKCVIVIHPNGSISFENSGPNEEDSFYNNIIHSKINDIFNISDCENLPEPYVLVNADDAGLLKVELNALASVLCGRIIAGNAIIFKRLYSELFKEHYLALLDSEDVSKLLPYLGKAAQKLAKEFGYSDEDND